MDVEEGMGFGGWWISGQGKSGEGTKGVESGVTKSRKLGSAVGGEWARDKPRGSRGQGSANEWILEGAARAQRRRES